MIIAIIILATIAVLSGGYCSWVSTLSPSEQENHQGYFVFLFLVVFSVVIDAVLLTIKYLM